jgi:hypothetical protein
MLSNSSAVNTCSVITIGDMYLKAVNIEVNTSGKYVLAGVLRLRPE